jgi:putative NADH-flavin reductase
VSTQSHLDWPIVCPAAYADSHRTGKYRHGLSGTDKGLKLKISRVDLAEFMLSQLTDQTHLHKGRRASHI